MLDLLDSELTKFIDLCDSHHVRMLMVGGGAVNLHGYQRHSADVDFWFELTEANFENLILVMNELGYKIDDIPDKVRLGKQNISFKFSPQSFTVELITFYSSHLTFKEAWESSTIHKLGEKKVRYFRTIGLKELIQTKIRSGRYKDMIDVQELKRINKLD